MELLQFCSYVLGACLIYLAYQVVKVAYFLFREYFVLWHVAVGAREDRRNMSAKIRLHAYVCKTIVLDAVSINELYNFAQGMVKSDVITIADFHQVLLSYKYAVMCRDRKDGSLRGIMLLGVDNKTKDGGNYTLIRLGLSLFQNYYRGGPFLYYVTAYHILKEMILHPRTPLYIAGKAFSYKSYVVMTGLCTEFYPRYGTVTPAFEKSVLNEFGEGIAHANEVYDRETCVLKRELSTIREHVAPITSEELKNPHIRFFAETNPGWSKGHQLCVVGKVTWSDMASGLFKALKRAYTARSEGLVSHTKEKRKSFASSSQLSFQQESANRYVVKYYNVMVNPPAFTQEDHSDGESQPHYSRQVSDDYAHI